MIDMIDISILMNTLNEYKLSDNPIYNGAIMPIDDNKCEYIDVESWPCGKIKDYLFGKGYKSILSFFLKEELSGKDAQIFFSGNGKIYIKNVNEEKILSFSWR